MANDLLVFISAEAAVKSKRKDYISLFDSKADINDLKKCRSDPVIMKEAVKKLKELGFSVTATGSCSLFFFGLPGLFERTFQVVLTATESPSGTVLIRAQPTDAAGAPAPGTQVSALITSVPGSLSDELAAILISQPATFASDTRPASGSNPDDIYLDELRGLLQRPPHPATFVSVTGKGVKVCVLDSGLRKEHPWLKGKNVRSIKNQDIAQIRAALRLLAAFESVKQALPLLKVRMLVYRDGSREEMIEQRIEVENILAQSPIQELIDAGHAFAPLKRLRWEDLTAPANLLQLGTPGDVIGLCEAAFARGKDLIDAAKALTQQIEGMTHGTGVCALVLAVAPDVEVHSINRHTSNVDRTVESTLRSVKPFVLNCSFGTDEVPEAPPGASENEKASVKAAIAAMQNSWKLLLDMVAAQKALCIIASGNVEKPAMDRPKVEPSVQHAAALVVGAGFYSRIGNSLVPKASSLAMAHPEGDHRQAIPHICGVSAGQGPPGGHFPGQIFLPAGENAWALGDGTSFAAPQVSGACALIKEAWPEAEPADVKAVLLETSVPLTTGNAWNPVSKAPYPLWNVATGHKVGLLHIGRALNLAQFCALVTVAGGGFSGLRAAHIISKLKTLTPVPAGQIPLVIANGDKSVGWKDALALFRGGPPLVTPRPTQT